MRLVRSARARILLSFVVLLAFSAVVSILAIDRLLSAGATDRVRQALEQEVGEFKRLAAGRDPRSGEPFGGDVRRIFDVYFTRNVPGGGETIAAYVDGRLYDTVSATSGGRAPLTEVADRLVRLRQSETGELPGPRGPIRYLAVPVFHEGELRGTFVVTADLGAELQEIDDATRIVALVLGAVLLIAGLLTWLVAGRVLAPLRVLSDTARAISESDLTRRIPVTGHDEIAELSHTFNAMLGRLQSAFEAQRSFINDASHELRTPITIVRGHLELLGDDPQERRETVALVTDELDRMSRFVDDLLLLAKVGRGDFVRPEPVDLDVLTDELLAKATALGERSWTMDSRAHGQLVADRQRLTQAMMGLAENACQHTNEGDEIGLGSSVENGFVHLWVRDTGPGVPLADHERIFERFARSANSRRRSEGAGLGLAIVRGIAEAHGGRVELSSRPGAGATFSIVIPERTP